MGRSSAPGADRRRSSGSRKSAYGNATVKHDHAKFSLKTGTIFEESPIPLEKWLPAAWLVINCKNGISSYEIARDLGVTQKSAWFMLHRIRLAMQSGTFAKLSGEVEADETFVGGRIQNMHRKSKRLERAKTAGTNWNKAIVLGLLERDGNVRAAVAPSRMKHHIEPYLRENVEPGSKLYTDDLPVYGHVAPELDRRVCEPSGRLRRWPSAHQRTGKLLESLEAWPKGYLREC